MAIEYIETKIFPQEKIISGVTTKNTSVFPKYGLSLSKADILSDDDLMLHQKVFAKLLGFPNEAMKYQQQIHSDIIRYIDFESKLEDGDGIYTDKKNLILNVKIADCAAVLIYDSTHEIIMALHSGWRGTAQNISGKGISILNEKYKSAPAELLVYISPSAGGDVYEVEEDVARLFPASVKQVSKTKFLFDNKAEIKRQLMEAGVNTSNIETSPLCTITDENLHSYRRDKKTSGRMSAFIGMLE